MFFVAFSVFLWAAIYISPLFCGSANEKKMLTKPEELDQGTFSQNLVLHLCKFLLLSIHSMLFFLSLLGFALSGCCTVTSLRFSLSFSLRLQFLHHQPCACPALCGAYQQRPIHWTWRCLKLALLNEHCMSTIPEVEYITL